MGRFLGLSLVFALVIPAIPAHAQTGDLVIVGVDPLLVRDAGGCKKIDAAAVRCSFKRGGYTYVYFEARRPKFVDCTLAVTRGPGERWRVNASPCIDKWNGSHVYISVPKK